MTDILQTLEQLSLTSQWAAPLLKFRELFLKWNQRINLSGAREVADLDEHICDALHVVPHVAGRVIDVGSGGGLPVVVAAICSPTTSFVAVEPTHKKHAFLRTAARELSLANLEAIAARIEDHPQRDYDVATSRATFDLRDWLLRGRELVRPGGAVIGFEAAPRSDLPAPIERHSYRLAGKSRAIVVHRAL